MNYEEALCKCEDELSRASYIAETSINRGIAIINSNKVDFLVMVRSALEKKIPKKPINHKDGFECKHFDCPCCQSCIVSVVDGELCAGRKKEYCDYCGQRLDWSEEE